jgi:hypothetical protein
LIFWLICYAILLKGLELLKGPVEVAAQGAFVANEEGKGLLGAFESFFEQGRLDLRDSAKAEARGGKGSHQLHFHLIGWPEAFDEGVQQLVKCRRIGVAEGRGAEAVF